MITGTTARRLITYKASPAPATQRQRLLKRFLAASIGSCGAVSLYLIAFAPTRSAETGAKDYSTTIRRTDTAEHPRNFKTTIGDAVSASTLLRTNQKSVFLKPGSANQGILSYHFNQVASNSPIEDDHAEQVVSRQGHDWSFFGLFDGHGGWTTSDKLKRELIPYVMNTLSSANESPESVQQSMKTGFENLDKDIVYTSAEGILKDKTISRPAAVAQLMPAMSGSCGLLAFYDSASHYLHVAVTGDSRAIYGHRVADRWHVRALSEDQTGSSATEVARLRAEHPGEENVVRNGRILGGLEPSRAFGDSRYKWPTSVQSKISERFYGRRAPAALISPPYVTARPEVTSTKIDTSEQGFMVLGTDGLYEMLTNEEIAELVIGWRRRFDNKSTSSGRNWIPSFLGGQAVDASVVNEDVSRSGQKLPQQKNGKTFVYDDENVATHIIRNALGGGDTNRLYGLLSLPYPLSRSYRDDISVTVVFFGEDQDRMPEASQSSTKAKL